MVTLQSVTILHRRFIIMRSFDNYSLLAHNTFGIDARCSRFVEYENVMELHEVLEHLRENPDMPFFHIGGGSNLLFTSDFEGIILHSAIRGKEMQKKQNGEVLLRVGAGEVWDELVGWCVEQGFYGFENLSHIPGEVGAAAVQNIGAYGKQVGDFIVAVHTVSVETGECRVFSKADCAYAYRFSAFKGEQRGKYVVTQVDFLLSDRFEPDLSYGALSRELAARQLSPSAITASSLRDLVVEVRKSKLPEPEDLGSAGSFFMNPIVEHATAQKLLDVYKDMPHYPMENGVKIPAGWLIEQCGWKGKRVGRVGVYEKQALVLVNYGGGSGQDICALSKTIQTAVFEKFGIHIQPEVNFI